MNESVDQQLYEAAERGDIDRVEYLISTYSDLDRKWEHPVSDWTALHAASNYGRTKIVEQLIKAGWSTEAVEERTGWTPLHLASMWGYSEIVQALISNHCKVNATDKERQSALYNADNADVAKVLISAGASVELVDDRGQSALHTARSAEIAKVLISAGAAVELVDNLIDGSPMYLEISTFSRFLIDGAGFSVQSATVTVLPELVVSLTRSASLSRSEITSWRSSKARNFNPLKRGSSIVTFVRNLRMSPVYLSCRSFIKVVFIFVVSALSFSLRIKQFVKKWPYRGDGDPLFTTNCFSDINKWLHDSNESGIVANSMSEGIRSALRISRRVAHNGCSHTKKTRLYLVVTTLAQACLQGFPQGCCKVVTTMSQDSI